MIDIHFHALPGIDDGPRSMAEAIALCRRAAAEGTTRIVATPHVLREPWLNEEPGPRAALLAELNLALGGPARYHGAWQMRPLLGEGQAPRARDIERCNNLVVATCLFWLLLIVLGFAYV